MLLGRSASFSLQRLKENHDGPSAPEGSPHRRGGSGLLADRRSRAGSRPDPFVWTELTTTYTATGQYGYEPFAPSDGYDRTEVCVTDVGYRYVNPEHIGSLDPEEPSALLYEDGPHGRKLTGVEWAVADTGQATPELFGLKFEMGQQSGQFTLRAWIYKQNPKGLFKALNRR
ncbi:hypothetical protein AB0D34_42745 [Streptomyces sp. NPDC048420]|uniref:hypothetical protein n=1 Tax=Streptomyces sp. NPDC048420 TaxID=3155755 RepID=UPI00341FF738